MTDLAIIFVAIALGSFVKGVTGTGLPLIAIPVMATFLGVERSVVIMTVPGVVSNAWMLWVYRRYLTETRELPTLLSAGVVGAVVGTWLLKTLDTRVLSLVLAGIIFAYTVLFFTHPDFKLRPEVTRYLSVPVGVAGGALQGAAGMSGPLVSTYLHGFRLDKAVYLSSVLTIFGALSVVQIVALASLGLYTRSRFAEGLLALLPLAVLPLGSRAARRLSPRVFEHAVLVLLIATALKMLYDGLAGA